MGSLKVVDIDMFPSDLELAVFSSEEIKKLSVVKITTGLTFDPLGHSLPGGLYDNAMGTFGKQMEPCATCFNLQACPGHMGHIELDALVYNPFFIKMVHKLLNISCLNCFKIQMKDRIMEIIILQLKLIGKGYIVEAQEMELFKSEIACQISSDLVKLENQDSVHPKISEMHKLLGKDVLNTYNSTKTSCAIRSAIVNVVLQRSQHKKCIHCQKPIRNVRFFHRKLMYYITLAELKTSFNECNSSGPEPTAGQNRFILPDECRKYLRKIYENHKEIIKLLYPILVTSNTTNDLNSPTDIFFMDAIPVTPPRARPSNLMRGEILEHAQTAIYRGIIQNNSVLRVILQHIKGSQSDTTAEAKDIYDNTKGATPYEKLYTAWQELQTSIDVLLDVNMSREAKSVQGLKQILEKKEGLIRKHMMGKRVNFAARTVITPDPNISVDEVGIPDIFARKLSYPVPVTTWNVAELRKMVMNGPDVHPGANYIQDEKGYTTMIPGDSQAKRESMAKLLFNYPENGIKLVHRHVLNGDILLLNRQPSLHKPSIMAHKARILSGEKTFRLHYSNCKAYNADFDGDEMNAHLPQSEVARSEAYNLVNVANNYLVPKDGTPLGGLIQDHVISGVKLSMRGRFFNRTDYEQLVFQALSTIRGNIKLMRPAIIKPVKLWSGKQILSTIIINLIPEGYPLINLDSNAKISEKQWQTDNCQGEEVSFNDPALSESRVIIRNGELLTGVLDKQQYGATTYGLIHCIYELYGGEISMRLLTAFTKVFTTFLQWEGFTLGVHDILVTSKADNRRRKIIKQCREIGNLAVANALGLDKVPELGVLAKGVEEAYIKDPNFGVLLDRKYKSILDRFTNKINKICLPNGLICKFPENNLQLMVLSGAKGSMVNTMQISCLLGQIELEGQRPPLMISGKSLPCFTSFETSPKSGGFIDGRFMTGIQPQDFFFHCMAGREGLIDTAVKTSRSGYLQRCLIKHLEGLTVNYDLTVRDSDNSVIQYLYGEDGLDILNSKFFNQNFALQFLSQNAKAILRSEELKYIKDDETLAKITRHKRKIRNWFKKHPDHIINGKKRFSHFLKFSAELRNEIEVQRPNEVNSSTGRRRLDEAIIKIWKKADEDSKNEFRKRYTKCPDPVTSIYKQDSCYGSVSESVEKKIDNFCFDKDSVDKDTLSNIMYIKNIKGIVSPGEPVGLLAAQSIGEPSTQMTLNTFHFAGRGEMNVTLGIPRLREILMLASSNIKTPSMDIPIRKDELNAAEKLRIHFNRVTLADVLEDVFVKIKKVLYPERAYQYQIRMQFLPREAYKEDFCVRPKTILKYVSDTFFKNLFRAIIKSSKSKLSIIDIGGKEITANEKDDTEVDENENQELNNRKKGKTNNGENDGGDSTDDEQNNNDDDDVMGIKLKTRKRDETEYDDPDDVEELMDANVDEDEVMVNETNFNNNSNEDEINDNLIDKVTQNEMVKDYEYDKDNHLWCTLTFNLSMIYKKPDISSITRELANKSIIHQAPNIKRAIIYKENDDDIFLKTDGINIVEMFKYNNTLDLNRLYTNDIHAIAKTYGIEAAAQVIIKEVTTVFKVYGITVDRRHLSLIADYMTFEGTFQPLSRKGMENSSSPLQQISFESSLQFLRSAAESGRCDELNSPSSRLIVGLPVKNGTGAFELLTKLF